MLNEAKPIKTRQKGNAVVEFALVATVLTPIFLLTPTLTKTADANLASVQAARYGAWEQTIMRKDGKMLESEIADRFYAQPDMAIRTDGGARKAGGQQNPFWQGAGFDDGPLTKVDNALSVQVRGDDLGGAAGTTGSAVHLLGNTLGKGVSDSEWDLDPSGLYTISIILNLNTRRDIPSNERSPRCRAASVNAANCIGRQAAILVDTWSASGPAQVADRVRSLVPAGMLQPVGDIVAIAGDVLPMFQELKNLDGAFGEIRPDILPPDRHSND